MKKYLLPLILILLLTLTLGGYSAWLDGWDKRIEISINNYAGDIGGSVTWFPVDVFLTATQAEEVFTELTTDAEYKKIQFTEADGTSLLYGHKILFDVSGVKGIFRVSADGWTINANTSIFLYYDKDHVDNGDYIGVTGTAACEAVYNPQYKAVYTMDDALYDIVNACDTTTDWTATNGTRTIDTGDKYSGTGSLKFVTDPAVGEGYVTFDPAGTWNWSSKTHLKVWMKGDTAESGDLYIFDVGGNWEYWTFTYPTSWTLMSFDLSAPNGDDGTGLGDWSDINRFRFDINAAEKTARYDEIRIYPGTLVIQDSTSNHNDGTKKGANEPNEVAGKVGQGQDFDGGDDYILVTHDGSLMFKSGDFSVSIWAKPRTISGWSGLITTDIAADEIWKIFIDNGDNFYQARFGAFTLEYPAVSIDDWHRYGLVKSGTTLTLYFDGAETVSGTCPATHSEDNTELLFGSYRIANGKDGANMYDGLIDEPKISSTVRSAAWFKGSYNSEDDTLLTYGSEETEAVVGITWNGITITKWNGVTITIPINTQ